MTLSIASVIYESTNQTLLVPLVRFALPNLIAEFTCIESIHYLEAMAVRMELQLRRAF